MRQALTTLNLSAALQHRVSWSALVFVFFFSHARETHLHGFHRIRLRGYAARKDWLTGLHQYVLSMLLPDHPKRFEGCREAE